MEETSQNLLELAEKIGVMLAESSLSEDVKNHLADNLDKLSGEMLVTLFEGLKADDEEMKRVAFDTELYLKVQEDAWKKVEADQKLAADTVGNVWVEKLK